MFQSQLVAILGFFAKTKRSEIRAGVQHTIPGKHPQCECPLQSTRYERSMCLQQCTTLELDKGLNTRKYANNAYDAAPTSLIKRSDCSRRVREAIALSLHQVFTTFLSGDHEVNSQTG